MEPINSELTKAKASIAHYIKGVRSITRYSSVHLNKNTETYKQHRNEILQCHHQHRVLLGRSNAGIYWRIVWFFSQISILWISSDERHLDRNRNWLSRNKCSTCAKAKRMPPMPMSKWCSTVNCRRQWVLNACWPVFKRPLVWYVSPRNHYETHIKNFCFVCSWFPESWKMVNRQWMVRWLWQRLPMRTIAKLSI